ncbi:MADS-box protein AGL71-like [Zingiber officinale]|uniref:MADS-box protein AGL71-like n=1 Tax=Zingiber officinale TaxID=94328 RepID=UPI001C4CC15D|nr:MADS-box protein AGL71-like [Zingiber officinale]
MSWSRVGATVLVVEEMWCEKIEIKRIENSTNQHVTFSKRRNGIIMEMTKISILYKEQVFVVIFSSSGKMSEFCSLSTIALVDNAIHLDDEKVSTKEQELRAELNVAALASDTLLPESSDPTTLAHISLATLEEASTNIPLVDAPQETQEQEPEVVPTRKRPGCHLTLAPRPKKWATTTPEETSTEDIPLSSPEPTLSSLYLALTSSTSQSLETPYLPSINPDPTFVMNLPEFTFPPLSFLIVLFHVYPYLPNITGGFFNNIMAKGLQGN